MVSEPYQISEGSDIQTQRSGPFYVVDEDGVTHVAHTYTRPVYGGYGNIFDEDIHATDCDIECPAEADTAVRVVTCLACYGGLR